jgi:hypothetical protein
VVRERDRLVERARRVEVARLRPRPPLEARLPAPVLRRPVLARRERPDEARPADERRFAPPAVRLRDPPPRRRDELPRVSPASRRCLLTVRAAISSARGSPFFSSDSLMCSYWRSRLLLTPRIGIPILLM